MAGRIIQVTNPFHLSTKLRQLNLTDKETGEVVSRPIEDLHVLVVEHPQVTWTLGLMQELLRQNVAVVFCDEHHMPIGSVLPLSGNTLQQERYNEQLKASVPLKKQLWKQTIQAKIKNQGAHLDSLGKDGIPLYHMAGKVQSGDPDNIEARAAQRYWGQLFMDEFKRDRGGAWPNSALNYGYAIVRAATARALVAAGLLPTFGIHHHNRYNAYALADDIMEPFRPFVDSMVIELVDIGFEDLDKFARHQMIGVLQIDVAYDKIKGPLSQALQQTANSLMLCYKGGRRQLSFPAFIE